MGFISTIGNASCDPLSIHTAKQEALYEREENSAIEHLATAYIQTYGIDHGDAVTRIQQDTSFWEMRKQVDSFVKKEMGYCNYRRSSQVKKRLLKNYKGLFVCRENCESV